MVTVVPGTTKGVTSYSLRWRFARAPALAVINPGSSPGEK